MVFFVTIYSHLSDIKQESQYLQGRNLYDVIMKYLYDDIDVDKPGDLGFEAEAVHNTITSLMDRLR